MRVMCAQNKNMENDVAGISKKSEGMSLNNSVINLNYRVATLETGMRVHYAG